MRFWVGVMSAFGAGTLIGIGLGTLMVEDKLKKEYVEANASFRRALEAARIDAETPAIDEKELDEPLFLVKHDDNGFSMDSPVEIEKVNLVDGRGKVVTSIEEGPKKNPYHQAVEATSPQIYASYAELEEEDYYEEDGRAKEQITMIYDNGVPRFFQSGEEIEDWMERVGGTVVDDMREAVRGGNPVLWIRNNQTDVDYEVLFEQP